MTPLFWRALLRHPLRHPWQLGLTILGIALGVAVVLAVDLANTSARRGFELAMNRITGHATHRILGGPQGVAETVYTRLRVEHGIRPAAPVVTGYLPNADRPGQLLQILGIDPFVEASFRDLATDLTGGDFDLRTLLLNPDATLLPEALGSKVALRRGGQRLTLRRAGTLRGTTFEGLLITDIATAQTLLGRSGRLDYIDLILPKGPAGERLATELHAWLPPDLRLERPAERNQATADLSAAFSLNLTAMSLLALVVGMFLIHNAMTFSVVRRRALLGLLRALGVAGNCSPVCWARRCCWVWRVRCSAACWACGWDRDWCIWSPAASTTCTSRSASANWRSSRGRWSRARRSACWRRWRRRGCRRGKPPTHHQARC
ncbi:MAG: ABC transporter permease [Candidatus Competibacteraceae bacterium]|nr:ABC transporter permease [Candidatus Competibacteraceae bacterium]